MRNEYALQTYPSSFGSRLTNLSQSLPRRAMVGIILMVALLAFEIFNFDTTRFALGNLMGDIRFLGLQWAAILAIAFCSIDFAGLVRLFTPEKGKDEPKEVWYLMGAWLLGATMNALMTWWAVSLTLLDHQFGNEVMSREQLLDVVPVFVAVLVWLTRILFIGAFTVAGEHIFDFSDKPAKAAGKQGTVASGSGLVEASDRERQSVVSAVRSGQNGRSSNTEARPAYRRGSNGATHRPAQASSARQTTPSRPVRDEQSRIKQRPPVPSGIRRMPAKGIQARHGGRN